MDSLLVFKAFFIGVAWFGTLLVVLAYVMPIFPLNALFRFSSVCARFSYGKMLKNKQNGVRWWRRSLFIFRFLGGMMWVGVMALLAWGLWGFAMPMYFEHTDPNFWTYYGIAGTLPFLYLFIWGIRFFRNIDKGTLHEPPKLPEDNRPYLQQLLKP